MTKKKNRTENEEEGLKNYYRVLSVFRRNPSKSFNYKQVSSKLKTDGKQENREILRIIEILLRDDKIEELKKGRYRYKMDYQLISGKIEITSTGMGYVIVEGFEEDILINRNFTSNAFTGDIVSVELFHNKRGRRPEGRVVEVIERKRTQFTGIFEKVKDYGFVIPDESKIHIDFFIPKGKTRSANNGDKVVVEIAHWPEDAKNPYGKITQVLGKAGEHSVEMHAILLEFGLEEDFPAEVLQEIQHLEAGINSKTIKGREDFRDVLTLTIDPADAKDFDDALSFKDLGNNIYEIGVHIADVAHYVKPGTLLDEEAVERGTSVYLVDRTIPMLPEKLSNEICSLRPQEESFCFACIFKINNQAQILDYRIKKTVIFSDKRYAYEEAQEQIESKQGEHASELTIMNEIAKKLKHKRMENGSLSFETEEVKFILDDNGKPLKIIPKIRQDAHKMIEEYMLLANKTIAKHVSKMGTKFPLPNRVHATPTLEKLSNLDRISAKFGLKLDKSNYRSIAESINHIIAETENTAYANMINQVAIRSMEKAYYTTEKSGHFGLAFEHYAHFTSPIRRYPDLMVHRLLEYYLKKETAFSRAEIEEICESSSIAEKRAVDAERASIKYKQAEYLEQYVGQKFKGVITGVTEWGIYVELNDVKCEGMVRLRDLKDDIFEYNEDDFAVIGKRTKKEYALGQNVQIIVKKTNPQKRTIDLSMVE